MCPVTCAVLCCAVLSACCCAGVYELGACAACGLRGVTDLRGTIYHYCTLHSPPLACRPGSPELSKSYLEASKLFMFTLTLTIATTGAVCSALRVYGVIADLCLRGVAGSGRAGRAAAESAAVGDRRPGQHLDPQAGGKESRPRHPLLQQPRQVAAPGPPLSLSLQRITRSRS